MRVSIAVLLHMKIMLKSSDIETNLKDTPYEEIIFETSHN